MKTIIDTHRKSLLIQYHVLCKRLEMQPHEKAALLEGYGVDSSADLSIQDLIDVVGKLEKIINPKLEKLDTWRKRVIASIDGYLKKMSDEHRHISKIKAIAIQATGAKTFNQIPLERLISIYHAFLNKQKDLDNVAKVTQEMIDYKALLN